MEEKKKFEKPVLKVVELKTTSVICSSTCSCEMSGMCTAE